jgi:hypothetical protein
MARLCAKPFLLGAVTASLLALSGCSPKAVRAPVAAAPAQAENRFFGLDNSFFDLEPGLRLRILVPLLKARGGEIVQLGEQTQGKTIVLSAKNLAGYRVCYYSVEDGGNGEVQLRFTSAETTQEGKTIQESSEPVLPFPLPTETTNIRLIYLIRVSPSDHNMAIAVTHRPSALDPFTERLQRDPGVCKAGGEVSCSWVPVQIAVTPEKASASGR